MPKRIYNDEFFEFMKANVKGRCVCELIPMIKEKFNLDLTENQIKSYKTNHHLRSGRVNKYTGKSLVFSPEMVDFIRNNYLNIMNKDLTDKLNEKFQTSFSVEQVSGYKQRNHLDSTLRNRFEKGHVPFNKGKKMTPEQYEKCKGTMFKKGNSPQNIRPVGSERITKDGYIEVKVSEPNGWKLKHIVIYEQNFGEVPKGNNVVFLNGNRQDLSIKNLACVDKRVMLQMNRDGYFKKDPLLTQIGINIEKLKTTTRDLEQRRINNEK